MPCKNDKKIIRGSKNHAARTIAPTQKAKKAAIMPVAMMGILMTAPMTLEKRLLARASRYPPILNPPLYDHE
jgi:hypothetical protein